MRALPKNPYAKALVQGGVIGADDIAAGVQLFKYSPGFQFLILVGIVPGLIFGVGFQRFCFLFVTDREVVVTPFGTAAKNAASHALRLQRPVELALAEDPKPMHNFGNKVQLPREIGEFLGRDIVYAQLGNVADDAFRIARTPAGRSGEGPSAGGGTLAG